jgi:effector-binding domain-containing protein
MSVVARRIAFLVLTVALAAAASAQAPATPPAAPPPPKPAPAEIQVVTLEPVHALVLPMKGSYAQHPEAFAQLGGFLAAKGITPSGPPFARYLTDPSVGEANLVWEVGFPVPAGAAVEAPFEVRDLPATRAVVQAHRGPLEELGAAWGALIAWTMDNGHMPVGPATQVFKGDLAVAPEVELRMPIQ